jgi:YegS/Rv2252/BmrU family lipid kinase
VLSHLRKADARVTVRKTRSPGEAEIFAGQAGDYDVVVVAGGDGTVNEAINGLGGLDGNAPPLAFIPLGTANILAHELGLPRSAGGLAETILRGGQYTARPGLANGRRFLLMASAGFDAQVVARVNMRLKRHLGTAAYIFTAFLEIWRKRATSYRVSVDGETNEAGAVVITRARHYGGGFMLVPQARLDERKLYVVCLSGSGVWDILRYSAALSCGRLHRLSDVRILEGGSVIVEGSQEDLVQIDGDRLGTLPLEVSVDSVPIALMAPPH